MTRAIGIALWALGMAPALALATPIPVQLCADQIAYATPDGRILGHIAYGEAQAPDLVEAPPGFAIGQSCYIQRAAAVDLTRMLRAAELVPDVGDQLRAVSCYRSTGHQAQIFCGQIGPDKRAATAADRARTVAPPGFSEHSTGYAIDFGLRPSDGCADVDSCIASTAPGRWLLAHAREYGFELSFPPGNTQRVTWEPWHWRWVGTSANQPGAVTARALFATARSKFAAYPVVIDLPAGRAPIVQPTGPAQSPGAIPGTQQPQPKVPVIQVPPGVTR